MIKTLLLVCGFSLLFGAPARADAIDDRVAELLPWVAKQTGFDDHNVKVAVLLVEQFTINQIAYHAWKNGDPEPEAITVGSTIFLPVRFELGKNDDILVHELTHVLQFVNDASFRCRGEQEKQAYQAQADFVDETGIGHKPDSFAMFMLQCTSYAVHYDQAQ